VTRFSRSGEATIERAQEKRTEPKMPAEIAADMAEGVEVRDPL